VTQKIHSRLCLEWGCIFVGFGNAKGLPMNLFHNSNYSENPDGLRMHGTTQDHGMVI
jgi:hypothetical protein